MTDEERRARDAEVAAIRAALDQARAASAERQRAEEAAARIRRQLEQQ